MSQQFQAEYFPHLAILDTKEILEKVTTSQWKLVDFPRRHSTIEATDKILSPWVSFCTNALRGLANAELVTNHIKGQKVPENLGHAIMDSSGNRSYILWVEALGDKEGNQKSIISVQSAFAMLLSEQVKAKLPPEVKHKIKVDEQLHQTVDKLVDNMYVLAENHRASENRRWFKIYHDR